MKLRVFFCSTNQKYILTASINWQLEFNYTAKILNGCNSDGQSFARLKICTVEMMHALVVFVQIITVRTKSAKVVNPTQFLVYLLLHSTIYIIPLFELFNRQSV